MTYGSRTAALAIGIVLLAAGAAPAEEREQPNIVFILSDDQRADMLSCAQNPYAKTPHLDRLAKEGVRFDRAFVSSAVCMPSRATFFTGKYPHSAGVTTIIHMPHTFHGNQRTFPARLHDAGYHTAYFGKWHVGEGRKRQPGFDHWAGYYASTGFFDPLITTNGKEKQYEGFTDFVVSDMAAAHIAKVAKGERPFFVTVGLAAPHLPFGYPKKYERLFADVDIAKPASFDEDFSKTGKARFMKQLLGIEEYRSGLKRYGTWDNYVKSYYRSSQSIDESVGKVLAALDKAGVMENTVVIYSSDHGYALGEHGLTEKLYSYEGTMRIPMLVRYPKAARAGVVRRDLVTNLDLAPTCLDLAGVEIPPDVQGRSWRPLLEAGKEAVADWRSDVFYFLDGAHLTVRTQRYKYVTYPFKPGPGTRPRATRDQAPELYDLDKDPDEVVNLIDDPQHASVLADMKRRLARHVAETRLSPRVDQTVHAAWLLGPVPADQEAAVAKKASAARIGDGVTVAVGDRSYTWQAVKVNDEKAFPITRLVGGKGDDRFLLAFHVDLLTDFDPFVRVVFPPRKAPLRGWIDGKRLYDRRTKGHPTELQFNWRFNPPLRPGSNTVVFAGKAADYPASRIYLQTWKGKTRLPR